MLKYLCLFLFILVFINIQAQSESFPVTIQVLNDLKSPLAGATIKQEHQAEILTNSAGNATFKLSKGKHVLFIINEDYNKKELHINVEGSQTYIVELKKEIKIEEVVITAKEGKGLTSSSVINRQAMEHLQPSSFSDLMELLPGGLSQNPNLSAVNIASIRENKGDISTYNTTSLGVQFLIDDNVSNTNTGRPANFA